MADLDGAPEPFGMLLRSLRYAAELTQEELADRAGVSARSIGDLERGRVQVPQRRTAELIAAALDLDSEQQRWFHRAARSGRDGQRLACVRDLPESGAGIAPAVTDPSVQPLAVIIVDLTGCPVDPCLVRAILDTVDATDGARPLGWVLEFDESAECGCS